MKQVSKSLSKTYLTAKVFLEDLEGIQTVLNKSEDFKIKTEDYEFSNVQELKSKYNNQKLNGVKISTRNPYVYIEFEKLWVRLYCGSDENTDAGVFYKLDSIISATSRKPDFLYSYYSFLLGDILFFIISTLVGNSNIEKAEAVILGTIFILWFMWVIYIRLFNSGEVILTQKGDMKNFLSRNKDQIVVGVFVAVVTVILTTLVTTYFTALHSALQLFFRTN